MPCNNNETQYNFIIPPQNDENFEIIRIPIPNQENHEN